MVGASKVPCTVVVDALRVIAVRTGKLGRLTSASFASLAETPLASMSMPSPPFE